ncbi:nucleotidyl transferase AbiEii/AbiGii toxin family protein [Mycobacterium simiae]|nr:nucleotidyl transferase AbiEii/AbiGii toxin family protein [Mycobacterium simiae]
MRARAQESRDRVAALEQRQREIEELLDARRTYGSEKAFRAALSARIREIARETGSDSAEVARRFALQQFVSRLFDSDPESWLVTGGTALQFRTMEARATADLDLAVTQGVEDLTAELTAAARRRAGEHGEFVVAVSPGTGPGAFTGKITYLLNGSRFAVAKLDVAVGRQFPFEPDTLFPDPVVVIDDVRPMSRVRTYAVASHVADKVAAMYELHGSSGASPSTRSHDLADIVILSRCARVDAVELRGAVRGQEQRRGLTVPTPLVLPSDQWRRSYPARVAEAGLPAELRDADAALVEADRFVGAVLDGRVEAGVWDPDRRAWMAD